MSSPAVRHVEHCMGTVFSIDVRAPEAAPGTIAEIVADLHRIDATFSTYRPDSEISRLRRGELTVTDCSAQVREVLDRCAELTAQTQGFFDCHLPGGLDPSGYVKGWAIQRASDRLSAAGAVNHCVNGGGDVQCAGEAEPGRPWTIGIVDPHRPGQTLATVSGHRLAVATSGTAERGEHVVDPRTGRRPDALASVTVVGVRIADVDAYATAALAMGEAARDWLADRAYSALIVTADGRRITVGPQAARV